jgi:hypothetical protein
MRETGSDYSSNADAPGTESAAEAEGIQARRLRLADRIPFVLRAWWLRDFKEYSDLRWHTDSSVTAPLWSSYSDPLCDTGSLDYAYEQ